MINVLNQIFSAKIGGYLDPSVMTYTIQVVAGVVVAIAVNEDGYREVLGAAEGRKRIRPVA